MNHNYLTFYIPPQHPRHNDLLGFKHPYNLGTSSIIFNNKIQLIIYKYYIFLL
jgi:hypothetical protein